MIISYFCKKGGVGKTTLTAYHAHYLSTLGFSVLILSLDDQNSAFTVFGADDKIFDREDNYIENIIARDISLDEIIINVRNNLDLIKTLNTDKLAKQISIDTGSEKRFKSLINNLYEKYDYIFIDYPPSTNKLSEILLDISDKIILVVGLDKLSSRGFMNTLQYFVDSEIALTKISSILPNSYSKNKKAPRVNIENLKTEKNNYLPSAALIDSVNEREIFKKIQDNGLSMFDEISFENSYDKKVFGETKVEMIKIFKNILAEAS